MTDKELQQWKKNVMESKAETIVFPKYERLNHTSNIEHHHQQNPPVDLFDESSYEQFVTDEVKAAVEQYKECWI